MKCLVLFPHQLYESLDSFKETHVYLVEHPMFFKLYHKVRLAHTRACMKKYWDYLSTTKRQAYIEHKNYKAFITMLQERYQSITIYDPVDKDIEKEYIKTFKGKLYIEYKLPNFLLTKNEFPQYYRHSAFYKYIKQKLDILKNTPNLDKYNRFKLPKNINIPPPVHGNGEYYIEACKYVGGNVDINILRLYPIDFATSKRHFERFLSTKLENYGKYQDAIVSSDTFVFHSNISALLNNGLLTPAYVIQKVLAAPNAPINSKEGFIRQVLGWREYMRYIYYQINPRDGDSDGDYLRIDWKAWTLGTTGIDPLDNEIKKCMKYAYAHHIVRLMIFLNMFILMRIHPQDIYKWFMSCCSIDAYPWVMYSNIYGMGWFDKRFTHKAYISSSNYILKMSDYKRGPWCQTWDDLYHRHRLI